MSYRFEGGAFVIDGFDKASPFCSFLPGLSGIMGAPLWTFYVNRGQGICSFGVNNKDGSIMEFSPANSAYKRVAREGFRTFVRADGYAYEPFAPEAASGVKRTMRIYPNSFTVEEKTKDFLFTVSYFTLPGEAFPALARMCSFKNISDKNVEINILDGLPEIIPYGITTSTYKAVSNLNKSWASQSGLEDGIPFFFTRSIPGDEAEVKEQNGGYFFASVSGGRVVCPIIDPVLIFGYDTAYAAPVNFLKTAPSKQIIENKYACGFTPLSSNLKRGEEIEWNTLIGFAADTEGLTAKSRLFTDKKWFEEKYKRSFKEAELVTDVIKTKTAEPLFDGYFTQSYMDNVLRGGKPYFFEGGGIVHLFSRKHGDPERDYNFFSLAAEYFSQGNGNFRDVCQNRRNDVFFDPEAGEFNIQLFFSLMQADGFNPLEVQGATFTVRRENEDAWNGIIPEGVRKRLPAKFTAGKLINMLPSEIGLKILNKALPLCAQNIEAEYKEGYWIDHWTYLMDLVDSYLTVFPDRKRRLLFDNNRYRYFVSPVRVLPRKEAYEIKNGKLCRHKYLERIKGRPESDWLRNQAGDIYETNLFVKMISLAAVKFSSLDQAGIGLDMDGARPGWNDAMNGIPGLFGSGAGEGFELGKLIRFILAADGYESVRVPAEISKLIEKLYKAQSVKTELEDMTVKTGPDSYWNITATAKEEFRAEILNGISGEEAVYTRQKVTDIFSAFKNRLDKGGELAEKIAKANKGIVPTYLRYEPQGYSTENLIPASFVCKPMTEFLEAPVRQIKTGSVSREKASDIYKAVKATDIYDRTLKMYKTSGSLEHYGYDIGRIRAFTPGWLERESVFLHMSLKYLLALLEAGLYDEFFESSETAFPPFFMPEVYGRSTMENSSFIATDVNPDPSIVGKGFVSRLSGSTSEVLSIWRLLFWGARGFFINAGGELCFELKPILPGKLFDAGGEASFTLLGKTAVTYVNPQRKDTFGENAAAVERMELTYYEGAFETVNGGTVTGRAASDIREKKLKEIKVFLI